MCVYVCTCVMVKSPRTHWVKSSHPFRARGAGNPSTHWNASQYQWDVHLRKIVKSPWNHHEPWKSPWNHHEPWKSPWNHHGNHLFEEWSSASHGGGTKWWFPYGILWVGPSNGGRIIFLHIGHIVLICTTILCIHMCMCTNIDTYIYIYTYRHVYVYVQTHMRKLWCHNHSEAHLQ